MFLQCVSIHVFTATERTATLPTLLMVADVLKVL